MNCNIIVPPLHSILVLNKIFSLMFYLFFQIEFKTCLKKRLFSIACILALCKKAIRLAI